MIRGLLANTNGYPAANGDGAAPAVAPAKAQKQA
jgi:hypothetical protein